MPTTYAHWHFGDTVFRGLPPAVQKAAAPFRALYDIGAQGPDVFFHYNCLKNNTVIRFGSQMHQTPMREHLALFRQNLPRAENRDAALSYLLGFLTHFTLDSYCHGYIERKSQQEGPSHDKIEIQYDRHLLLKDGKNPYRTNTAASLHPTAFNARVMAGLYGTWGEKVMRKAVRDQVFYRNLLRDSSRFKRAFLTLGMRALGAEKYMDMMMGPGEHPLCENANLRLDKLYAAAAAHCGELAANMLAYFRGEGEMDPYFAHNFGPKADWQTIPLLSAREEAAYAVGKQR